MGIDRSGLGVGEDGGNFVERRVADFDRNANYAILKKLSVTRFCASMMGGEAGRQRGS